MGPSSGNEARRPSGPRATRPSGLGSPSAVASAAPVANGAVEGRVTVLYVGGAARSGSTLLDRILHTLPGYTSVGELVCIFKRGVLRNERCACGQWFRECEFWLDVGSMAFGGWDTAFAEQVVRQQDEGRLRWRYGIELFSGKSPRRTAPGTETFVEAFVELYRTLSRLTGARVLVDSSKAAIQVIALSTSADVDLRLVHLVRDPQGTVYSWSKQRIERPNANEWQKTMPSYSTARATWMWTHANMSALVARGRCVTGTVMLYDDLVTNTRATLSEALSAVDLDADLSHIGGSTVTLRPGHFLGGNPWRSATAEVSLRRDDEWEHELPTVDRVVTGVATAPLTWWLRCQAAGRSSS